MIYRTHPAPLYFLDIGGQEARLDQRVGNARELSVFVVNVKKILSNELL
jgi:hypothetical protein